MQYGKAMAVHVKMEVDFTVEQDYNLQNIERSKIFRVYIVGQLANKVRVRV